MALRKILLLALILANLNILAQVRKKKYRKQVVLVETNLGNFKLKLYDETPLHKENFLKLVDEGFYDDLLFHRVIEQFMIQGGDPDSKSAKEGTVLGNGGPGYTIPAELNPQLFHKKGALAAARLGDDVNPEKESSGSQFYVVHGRVFTATDLQMMETQINNGVKQELLKDFIENPENFKYKNQLQELSSKKDQTGIQQLIAEITPLIESDFEGKKFMFSDKQKEAYTSQGGAPHLDGGYTVFGEVIEGLEVIDRIAMQATNQTNRPKSDVIMKMKLVKK